MQTAMAAGRTKEETAFTQHKHWPSSLLLNEDDLVLQGDATLVSELWKPLFQAYVEGFQNPSSHLMTNVGDLLEHMKCIDT